MDMPPEFVTSTKAWRLFRGFRDVVSEIQKERPSLSIAPLPKLATFIESQLNTLDPELVTASHMPGLQQHFANAVNEVNALKNDQNTAHVEQIRNHLAGAITILTTLPKVTSPEDIQAAYASVIDQTRANSEAIVRDLARTVDELKSTADTTKNALGRLSSEVEALKGRTDSVVTEFQKQFSDNENTRAQRLDEVVKKLHEEGAQHFAEFNKAELELRDRFVRDADAVLKTLRTRDEETLKLALAMGAKGISSTFQATANRNETDANWLRGGAIALLIALVIVVVWALTQPTMEQTLMRFAAALLFGIPAAYLARESSRQRAEAVRSRRIELELSALGPFIENLDATTKADLRKQLVATYFGKAFDKEGGEQTDSIMLGGTLIDVIKAGKELLKR